MRVWLVKDGEQLPLEPGVRLMRMGMLAAELQRRGHSVTWWSSTFSHQRKRLMAVADATIALDEQYYVRLIHAGSYHRNISLQRYLHHRRTARRFHQQSEHESPPDVIVAAFPTIDLAKVAVEYGREHGIPVIVDVRDPWPEVYVHKSPKAFQGLVRFAFAHDFRKAARLIRSADCVVATSEGFLRWARSISQRPHLPGDRVFSIGHLGDGAPDGVLSGRMRPFIDAVKGKVVFTFIGSFGRSYDLEVVCNAARRLAADSRVHFAIAGDGQQQGIVTRAAAELPNLTYLGWLDDSDVRQLLQRSDVGLIPCISLPDTMPNKVFDYLSAGLPVISSLEGQMESIVARFKIGYSFTRGDVDTLVRHVGTLGGDPSLRAQFSRNSQSLFHREYNARVIYAEYASHVERIAAMSNAGST